MKTLIPAFLTFVAVLGPTHTQQPAGEPPAATTEAERQFRDAWWAESGKNDLELALRGYLAAVAADGPASVRAKALLHAGALQQRLGKADAALDTFRKILTEYATERASVDQARVHLRELTAVDLRQNYDEWYERRLFGEEIQLVILGKLEALTSLLARRPNDNKEIDSWQKEVRGLQADLLAFGKGALPALRKASLGGHEESREYVISMLFSLGEVPPAAALLSTQGWLGDPQNWSHLLKAPRGTQVPASSAWHRALLVAALRGPSDLLHALLESRDHSFFDSPEIATAITAALLDDASSRDATLDAIRSTATPLRWRPAMERALIDAEDRPLLLSAQQWLLVSTEPLQFELRIRGIARAGGLLGKEDEALLEQLLVRAEAASDNDRQAFTAALTQGLSRLVAPLDVPWTAARLRRLMLLAQWANDGNIVETTRSLCLHEPARAMLAEAILGEPHAFCAALKAIPDDKRVCTPITDQMVLNYGDERDTALVCTRWHAAMLSVIERNWKAWDDTNRAHAVWLLQQGLRSEGATDQVRTFLSSVKAAAGEPVRVAIEALFTKLDS